VTDVIIQKVDEVYVSVSCDKGIAYELSEFFTFFVPNFQFMPAYRDKRWDGKIRLYNIMTKRLYAGLVKYVEEFGKKYGYTVEYAYDRSAEEFSLVEAQEWIKKQNFPLEPRDYQVDTFVHAIRNRRALYLSATSSGKSFNMYMIMRKIAERTLIIVPTVALVHQMTSDFEEYGLDVERFVHKIHQGQGHCTNKPIVITTWQSVYRKRKDWFNRFKVVFGDEAHTFKAKALTTLMEKLEDCPYRYGFTGTIDDTETHKLVLEGLFGPVKKVISAKEMIDRGYSAEFSIKIICFDHREELRKAVSKVRVEGKNRRAPRYAEEMDLLVALPSRNRFIRNLTLSLKGNTLLLFHYVEKHGQHLYDMIHDKDSDRKVFFVHGGVDGTEREEIRKIVEKETDAIIVASYGVFSTGVNIKNLNNIIFASPSKAKIKILQSIGRSLRKGDNLDLPGDSVLYDIADDASWKSRQNFTLQHLKERMKIYDAEGFDYKLYNVKLG